MTGPALTEVVDGLVGLLGGIDGLTVYNHVPGQANFPAALIIPPTIPNYRDDLAEGSYEAIFEVAVLVGAATVENQRTLIPFIDPRDERSIFQAVEADRTLGGLDVDALVTGAPRRTTFDEVAAYKAWGQIVTIAVYVG